jgi:hypothetical protein
LCVLLQVVGAGGDSSTAACTGVPSLAITAVLHDTAALTDSQSTAAAAAAEPQRPLQANCGVLCVLHASLKAAAAAADAAGSGDSTSDTVPSSDIAAVAALMPDVVTLLNRLQVLVTLQQQQQQQQGVSESADSIANGSSGLQISKYEDVLQRQQVQLWLLLLWQDVLAVPPSISQLQPQQLTAAAQQLLQLALHGSSTESQLELAPGCTASEQGAAAAALTQLAAWPNGQTAAAAGSDATSASSMQALSSCADQLLQLLQAPPDSEAAAAADGVGLRLRAVKLLGQLAGSGPAAAWQVLQWLRHLVLQYVREGSWVSNSNLVFCVFCYCYMVQAGAMSTPLPTVLSLISDWCLSVQSCRRLAAQQSPVQLSRILNFVTFGV